MTHFSQASSTVNGLVNVEIFDNQRQSIEDGIKVLQALALPQDSS